MLSWNFSESGTSTSYRFGFPRLWLVTSLALPVICAFSALLRILQCFRTFPLVRSFMCFRIFRYFVLFRFRSFPYVAQFSSLTLRSDTSAPLLFWLFPCFGFRDFGFYVTSFSASLAFRIPLVRLFRFPLLHFPLLRFLRSSDFGALPLPFLVSVSSYGLLIRLLASLPSG